MERLLLRDGGQGAPCSIRAPCGQTAHLALLSLPCWPRSLGGHQTQIRRHLQRHQLSSSGPSRIHPPALRGFSSGPGGRARKAHRQCGAHRRCGAHWGRAHRGDMREWSTGYRATCRRKAHEGVKEAGVGSRFCPQCSPSLLTSLVHLHHLHLCDPNGLLTGLPTPLLPLVTTVNLMARVIFHKHKSNHLPPLLKTFRGSHLYSGQRATSFNSMVTSSLKPLPGSLCVKSPCGTMYLFPEQSDYSSMNSLPVSSEVSPLHTWPRADS